MMVMMGDDGDDDDDTAEDAMITPTTHAHTRRAGTPTLLHPPNRNTHQSRASSHLLCMPGHHHAADDSLDTACQAMRKLLIVWVDNHM